jgi:hypothetical protein
MTPAIPSIRITLDDHDGRFVHGADIPWFKPLPTVILWGARAFAIGPPPPSDLTQHYTEVFAYTLVDGPARK